MRKLWDRNQMLERYKKGFGSGAGAQYKPWLGVGSFSSRGTTHRQMGRLTGRHHILFSDHELATFMAVQWLSRVIDIREQYPLWPLDETEQIAARVGVAHPGPNCTNPQVMTTDLLLTLDDGTHQAISVKPSSELNFIPILQRLEIERRYWDARGIAWLIVTERDISPDLAWNLLYLDDCYDLRANVAGKHGIDLVEAKLFEVLEATVPRLDDACLAIDAELGLEQGVSLTIARRAIARKHWSVSLESRIDPSKPLRGLRPGPVHTGPVAQAWTGEVRQRRRM